MRFASWKLASVGAALCLALWAAPAGAQRSDDMNGAAVQHPCAGDAQSICSEFIPDRAKVASCLFKNKVEAHAVLQRRTWRRAENRPRRAARTKGKAKIEQRRTESRRKSAELTFE